MSAGRLCGASYINENFQKKLLHKLSGADYLEANGVTLTSIAQEKTNEFENHQKRVVDVNDRKAHIATIFINYLREDRKKHFSKNNLELKRLGLFGHIRNSFSADFDIGKQCSASSRDQWWE